MRRSPAGIEKQRSRNLGSSAGWIKVGGIEDSGSGAQGGEYSRGFLGRELPVEVFLQPIECLSAGERVAHGDSSRDPAPAVTMVEW
jgi:hypothetical protein